LYYERFSNGILNNRAGSCKIILEVNMNEDDFEGTLVLEKLAEIDLVDDFFDAIDSDDIERVISLLKEARVDSSTIAIVIKQIEDSYGDN
jgi:hypothetical protein